MGAGTAATAAGRRSDSGKWLWHPAAALSSRDEATRQKRMANSEEIMANPPPAASGSPSAIRHYSSALWRLDHHCGIELQVAVAGLWIKEADQVNNGRVIVLWKHSHFDSRKLAGSGFYKKL